MSRPTTTPRSELVMALVVLALLALLIHPYWMPMGLIVIIMGILALIVFGLGVFVWRESPRDEREYQLTAQAGRAAYLFGGAVMTIGVVVQTFAHDLDLWLVLALAGMVLTKVIASYQRR